MLDPAFDRVLRNAVSLPHHPAANKVMPLAAAVARHVTPGMTLHFASTTARPIAAVYEIIRQFAGRNPRFTMVTIGSSGPFVLPVAAGIVGKVVTTFAGDSYPTPGPNPVFQRTHADGSVAYEHWSILTLALRLKAGAMGLPYLPTRSLIGSTMAEENHITIEETADGPIARVPALRPDISIVHAWAADPAGNAVIPPPYGEHTFGVLGAKRGAIITADHIVSTDVIRQCTHSVLVPQTKVLAVCEARYGAHPTGMNTHAFPDNGWTAYADDYEFLQEIRAAAKSPATMEAFLREWVHEPQDWDGVVAKLGANRLDLLERLAQDDGWQIALDSAGVALDSQAPPNPIERMIVAAARMLCDRVSTGGYDTILAGVGFSNLAAWLAHSRLRRAGRDTALMAEMGFVGYQPRPADPFIFNMRNVPTCTLLADVETVMGMLMSGHGSRCLGAIGAGQIDKFGNINSTRLDANRLLVGSGGANDVASGAQEVLACALLGPSRFVEHVEYITSPGLRVRTLVTPDAVFSKLGNDQTFTLTAVLASHDNRDAAVRDVTAKCGWLVPVADSLADFPQPDMEEVRLLRLYDPRGQFLGKPAEQ